MGSVVDLELLAEMEATNNEKKEKETVAQKVLKIVGDIDLFHTSEKKLFARVPINNHFETWSIDSNGFDLWLQKRFFEEYEKTAGSKGISEAISILKGKALFEGEERQVYNRVAEVEGDYYLDLCNKRGQAVKITPYGWEVIDNPQVDFKRSGVMNELPVPASGGKLEELRPFVNIQGDTDWKMVIAWLIGAFRPNTPYTILTIQGEQGSSKSTTTKVLRSLIDPSSLPLRALSKDERDLSIAASNAWILAFDNLSGLSNSMSDSFCKLATGGGLATRTLHSNDEETIFNVMRPVILNGIDDIGKRPDLLDRSIVLNLPSIPEHKRSDEETFWRDFETVRPRVLGALLDVVSGAMKELPNVKLKKAPRMADFAKWVTSAEKVLGWREGEFMEVYNTNRNEAVEQGLESDPFASAILQLMNNQTEYIGNASQLLGTLRNFTDERTLKTNAWPTSRKVRDRIRRINPSLRSKGINFEPWDNKTTKTLKLWKQSNDCQQASFTNKEDIII